MDKFDFFLYANHIFYFKHVFLPFRDLIKKPDNDQNPKEIAEFERNNKSVQKFKSIIHQTVLDLLRGIRKLYCKIAII